jgi:ribosomal protein S18 acetylase RimI-like enzyme
LNFELEGLVRLTKSDIERGAEVLSRAFQDDALESYFIPDTEIRRRLLPHFFQYRIRFGILYGEVYTTSPEFEGIAVWFPPGKSEMTPWKMMRAGGISLQRKVGKEIISKMALVSKYVTNTRRQHVSVPHWHLFPMGVDPPNQGKGYASALLRPMFKRIDAEGIACYLETQNERNVSLYQHYGFKVIHAETIPSTDIMTWSMIRFQDS